MNLLCKLGLHRIDPWSYVIVHKRTGRHKWHTNYAVCERCGKLVYRMQFKRDKL